MRHALELLLVEDNEGDVEMVQRAFRNDPGMCNIAVAHDGMSALEYLRKEGKFAGTTAPVPNLIMLDLNMPGMDGKRFLEVAKEDAQLKAIPVVMFTSSESPGDIQACYERYASCYVVKPFDGREFMEAVRQIVKFWGDLGQLP